jgi:hypothetical protein
MSEFENFSTLTERSPKRRERGIQIRILQVINMASKQLDTMTPSGAQGRTVILDEKSRVIVHPRTAKKLGYASVGRYNTYTGRWRQAHLRLTSLATLRDNLSDIRKAFDERSEYRCELGRTQLLVVSVFDKDEMPYLSIQHKVRNADDGSVDHSKTVNLNHYEFKKMADKLEDIIGTAETTTSSTTGDSVTQREPKKKGKVAEPSHITAYKYLLTNDGGTMTRESPLYATRAACSSAITVDIEGLKQFGIVIAKSEISEIKMPRPNYMEVIERIMMELVNKGVVADKHKNCEGCYLEHGNQEAHFNGCLRETERSDMDNWLLNVTRQNMLPRLEFVLSKLTFNYTSNVVSSWWDLFIYVGGLSKVVDNCLSGQKCNDRDQSIISSLLNEYVDNCCEKDME